MVRPASRPMIRVISSLILVHLVLTVAATCWVGWTGYSRIVTDWSPFVCLAVLTSQGTLLGAWLGLGNTPRSALCFMASFALMLELMMYLDRLEASIVTQTAMLVLLLLPSLLLGMVLRIARGSVMELRLCIPGEQPPEEERRRWQFGIRHLLWATAITAIALGVLRMVGILPFASQQMMWIAVIVACLAGFTFCSALAGIWGLLGSTRPLAWIAGVLGCEMLVVLLGSRLDLVPPTILGFIVTQCVVIHGTWLVLRRFGCRLIMGRTAAAKPALGTGTTHDSDRARTEISNS